MNTIKCKNSSVAEQLRLCIPHLAEGFRDEARLGELALDSMDTVELLCVIHEEFGVRLSEEEFQPQRTVAELAAIIAEKAAAQQPANSHL